MVVFEQLHSRSVARHGEAAMAVVKHCSPQDGMDDSNSTVLEVSSALCAAAETPNSNTTPHKNSMPRTQNGEEVNADSVLDAGC